jgi:hypothetical protein
MRYTISLKIVVITIVVLVMTLIGSTVGTGVLFTRVYTNALESKSLAIGQSLHSQLMRLLSLNIPLENLLGFENQCKAVVDQYEGISYAMVVEPSGRIVFHNAPVRHGRNLSVPVELPSAEVSSDPKVRKVGPFF